MLRFPVVPKPEAELKGETTPKDVAGKQREALAWTFFDTATYTSGTTTTLRFFQTSRSNDEETNLGTPGNLTSPKFFQIYYFGLDLLLPPGDGAWSDAHDLVLGGNNGGPTWEFELASKSYGIFPLSFLHASGGPQGFGFSTATDDSVEYARNSRPDGGWCVDGAIIIPPQEGFSIELSWSSPQTLNNGDTDLRVWMAGVLYRRVL